jgi:hypothetical protein
MKKQRTTGQTGMTKREREREIGRLERRHLDAIEFAADRSADEFGEEIEELLALAGPARATALLEDCLARAEAKIAHLKHTIEFAGLSADGLREACEELMALAGGKRAAAFLENLLVRYRNQKGELMTVTSERADD